MSFFARGINLSFVTALIATAILRRKGPAAEALTVSAAASGGAVAALSAPNACRGGVPSRAMQHLYLLGAVVGLVTAVFFGAPYLTSPGASVAGFVALANANAPAATLSADIAVVYVVANVWLVVEGRRLGMRHLWAYVLGNTMVAVAFGLSMFLWARERRIRDARATSEARM